MGDISKWAAVDKGRRPLKRLHEIRFDGILEQQRQSPRDIELLGANGTAIACIGDDDFSEALFHVRKTRCQTKDSHHL